MTPAHTRQALRELRQQMAAFDQRLQRIEAAVARVTRHHQVQQILATVAEAFERLTPEEFERLLAEHEQGDLAKLFLELAFSDTYCQPPDTFSILKEDCL